MWTVSPNNNVCVTEATGMNMDGCDMPNDNIFALFWAIGDVVGPHGGKMKNRDFVVMDILEIKTIVFICLPVTEGCDSFPKRLDLALALNKTNEGVKNNELPSIMINRGTL